MLAGCSDGGTANETLPSTSTSAAQTTESLPPLGPPEFPVPDEARKNDPAGAEAALRYYLDLLTHQAGISGQPLRDLSRDCAFCDDLAGQYDSDAQAGYQTRGGETTVTSMSRPYLHDGIAEFSFSLRQTALSVVDPAGNPAPGRGSPEAEVNVGASMSWSEPQQCWLMDQLVTDG
jgi:hypothetical protein